MDVGCVVWCVCVAGGGQLKRTERAVKAAEKELAAETVAMVEREKKAAKEAQGRIDDVSTGNLGGRTRMSSGVHRAPPYRRAKPGPGR